MKKKVLETDSHRQVKKYSFFLVVMFCALSVATSVSAQDNKAEVFGGFSYLRAKPNNSAFPDINMPGWNASLTGYLKPWFGATADFSGNYRTESIAVGGLSARDFEIRQHGFLFGPRLRLLRRKRFTGSIAIVGGIAHGSVKDKLTGISQSENAGAMAAGSSIDVNITSHWAWRIQPNFYVTWFDGDAPQKSFRLSTGILYRFGGH